MASCKYPKVSVHDEKNVGGGFFANMENVTSITAVFSLTFPFMVYIK